MENFKEIGSGEEGPEQMTQEQRIWAKTEEIAQAHEKVEECMGPIMEEISIRFQGIEFDAYKDVHEYYPDRKKAKEAIPNYKIALQELRKLEDEQLKLLEDFYSQEEE